MSFEWWVVEYRKLVIFVSFDSWWSKLVIIVLCCSGEKQGER